MPAVNVGNTFILNVAEFMFLKICTRVGCTLIHMTSVRLLFIQVCIVILYLIKNEIFFSFEKEYI